MFSVAQIIVERHKVEELVNKELEGMWFEGLEIISRHLSGGIEEIPQNFYQDIWSRPIIEPGTSKI